MRFCPALKETKNVIDTYQDQNMFNVGRGNANIIKTHLNVIKITVPCKHIHLFYDFWGKKVLFIFCETATIIILLVVSWSISL